MTPEKLGEVVAAEMIKTPIFVEAVVNLTSDICDDLIRNVATKLRIKSELALGISFVKGEAAEENHYEFTMSYEGDMCRAIQKALAKHILEH
jgi:hypothetical protein